MTVFLNADGSLEDRVPRRHSTNFGRPNRPMEQVESISIAVGILVTVNLRMNPRRADDVYPCQDISAWSDAESTPSSMLKHSETKALS